MKRITKIAIGAAAALTLGIGAAAVSAHPYGDGPGWGMGQGYGPGHGPGAGMGPGMGRDMGPGGGMGSMGFGPMGFGRGQGYGNPSAMAEARSAYLKSELKITSGQESAWQAFAAKAKQQAESMQAAMTKMRDTQTASSAPDRLVQRNEIMKQKLAGMDTMAAASKDLYAVLTSEQKAIADQRFAGGGPGFRGPGGRFR